MSQVQILASKICPALLIGEKLLISSRNIKANKKPPKKSINCNCIFKEFITDNTTDITLNEDYDGEICIDIINQDFLIKDSSLSNGVNLKHLLKDRKNDTLNGNRFLIFSTNHKLLSLKNIINKSGRHKATEYKVTDLTLCNLIEEDVSIFKSKNIDKFRKEKLSQIPNEKGCIFIEKPTA
jgi:hypothetical protein